MGKTSALSETGHLRFMASPKIALFSIVAPKKKLKIPGFET